MEITIVDFGVDWVAYYNDRGELMWQGHPGDFIPCGGLSLLGVEADEIDAHGISCGKDKTPKHIDGIDEKLRLLAKIEKLKSEL